MVKQKKEVERIYEDGKCRVQVKAKRMSKKLSNVKAKGNQELDELVDTVVLQLQKQVPTFRDEIRTMLSDNAAHIEDEGQCSIAVLVSVNVLLDSNTKGMCIEGKSQVAEKDKLQIGQQIDPAYI